MNLKHIGLFEGIGGFSLAARWMEWETVAWCEWNKFGQRVLRYHFPKAKEHGDITTTDFRPYRGKCDILTGGFPCQPYSSAGKRLGKEDDRHLWPEMLRAIREIRPKWVVGENVLGIVNWNDGLVFDEVQADLEAEGYEVQPYVLPAVSVNAPHRRDRVWFVAFNTNGTASGKERDMGGKNGERFSGASKKGVFQETHDKRSGFGEIPPKERIVANSKGSSEQGQCKCGQREGKYRECGCENVADTYGGRFTGKEHGKEESGQYSEKSLSKWFKDFPTQPPIRCRNDGLPTELDGITFPKWRNESIKAYGNAIVPQVALQIFKAIEKYDSKEKSRTNN